LGVVKLSHDADEVRWGCIYQQARNTRAILFSYSIQPLVPIDYHRMSFGRHDDWHDGYEVISCKVSSPLRAALNVS
jgi:hypothetical protein